MSTRISKTQPMVLGAEPRVDLLPPEVRARVAARAIRRMLGLLVVLTIVAVGGAYVVVNIRALTAASELAAAQATTVELLVEQGTYAEAASASDLLDAALRDRDTVLSNEVRWADLIDVLRTVLPAGATIDSATMTSRAPWEAEMAIQGPLRSPRVATITFVIASTSLLDTPAIVRALSEIPGYADATPDRVDRSDTTFSTTITLNLNADIVHDRSTGGEEDDD